MANTPTTPLHINLCAKKMEPLLVTAPLENGEHIDTSSHEGQEFEYVLEGTLRLIMGGRSCCSMKATAYILIPPFRTECARWEIRKRKCWW